MFHHVPAALSAQTPACRRRSVRRLQAAGRSQCAESERLAALSAQTPTPTIAMKILVAREAASPVVKMARPRVVPENTADSNAFPAEFYH